MKLEIIDNERMEFPPRIKLNIIHTERCDLVKESKLDFHREVKECVGYPSNCYVS